MRYYSFAYPVDGDDVVETLSEDDIISQYYTYWATKMLENVRDADISRENCIEDWKIVHWAWEVTGENE